MRVKQEDLHCLEAFFLTEILNVMGSMQCCNLVPIEYRVRADQGYIGLCETIQLTVDV